MVSKRSVNLLPNIFQTDTNKKFLSATLDQLISEPNLVNINGYIGRKFAPTFTAADSYINEPTVQRQNYQLEPGIVIKNEDDQIGLFSDYVSLLNKIKYYGGITDNHDRLFENEFYSYDPHIDLDKFVNFSQYYWLPNGPDPVDVNSGGVPLADTFDVVRNLAASRYEYFSQGELTKTLVLARGGTYTFNLDQSGNPFWIQSEPGVDGRLNAIPTISSRDVLGVTNNGADSGTVTFNVPGKEEHQRFVEMPNVFNVDYAVPLAYTDIHNNLLSVILTKFPQFAGIVSQADGKHLIFVDEELHTSRGEDAWTAKGVFDLDGFQIASYDEGAVVPLNKRYGVWRVIFFNSGIDNDPIVRLLWVQDVAYEEKVYVKFGIQYANLEFYKENTGFFVQVPLLTALLDELYVQDGNRAGIVTRIKIVDPIDSVIDIEADILGQKNYTSPNGVVFTSGLKIEFAEDVVPESYRNKEYYVENVGDSINLVLVDALVTPELYHSEQAIQFPGEVFPEYITIKRDSLDLNGWSRANRWFHIDIITKTAEYNNVEPTYDQKLRAQRPIIEFDSNLQLANQGRIALPPIDALDATSLDPFNDFEGKILDTAFGVPLFDGLRVLFAAARDPEVRGKIYTVNLVQYSANTTTGESTGPFYIKLNLVSDRPIEAWDTTVVKDGQFKGSGWWYNGQGWQVSQDKSRRIQEPLFDVFDKTGKSLSEWPNSTFAGTKLFGYLENSAGTADPVLGIKLKYRNFGTQGDIEFKNFFDTDIFAYDLDGRTVSNLKISENGFLQKYTDRYTTESKNCWITISEPSKQYQIFTFIYDGSSVYTINGVEQSFLLDITPAEAVSIPHVKVFRNSNFLTESFFTHQGNVVTVLQPLEINDKIDILVFSEQVSKNAYYEIPPNLNLNAQNIDINEFTLGQIRNHLVATSQNSLDLDRPVIGPNNLRDLQYKQQGGTILQHSAPAPYPSIFLTDDTTNLVTSIRFSQNEYTKFKNKFLELSATLPGVDPTDPQSTVDLIIANINSIKNVSFPYFYSDMVPYGKLVNEIQYTVFDPLVRSYEISNIFDDRVLSNKAVIVYRNGIQLLKDLEYQFDKDRPAVTFTAQTPLQIDDTLLIVEYENTDGNYIPATPTKLGLYPKYLPEIFLDDTYRNPILVVRGHDGSLTPAFNDYRDILLLELEKRIYNNIKLPENVDYTAMWTVLPGKFRKNNYGRNEITQLLSKNFLSWVGSNKLDFNTNSTFQANDEFTWNYSRFVDRLDDEFMPGSWRACYLYYYDSIRPHTAPWEMLGFSIKPTWWEEFYGPAPYTGGNKLLWDDLEQGLVRFGPSAGIIEEFARPGLSKIIPVDVYGNLLPPSAIIAKSTQSKYAATSWSVGDIGPAEYAWRASSDFAFAVQQALAIAKPAKYFSTKADLSTYRYDNFTKQYLNVTNNRHFRQQDFRVHGSNENGTVVRTAGYTNFIADYLKNLGIDPKSKIDSLVKKYEVKLAYKVAGYTDKKFIRVLAEQSSPTSTNDSVLIPDENYYIHLFKSTPTQRVVYSGVIIEKTTNGYSVSGYNTNDPYFTIIPSVTDNDGYKIRVLEAEGIIFRNYQNLKLTVPYGYEFKNQQQVVDFLVSYERYLVSQGMVFDDMDPTLGEIKNFKVSAKEFLFWAQQGWKVGSLLFLSPISNQLKMFLRNVVVDKIDNTQYGTRVLDQNFSLIRNSEYDVFRDSNEFKFSLADESAAIGLIELNLVQYEHVMIFDNVTVFNDIIYKPELGNRQFRLKLIGQKTGKWDGSIYAPGFVFNSENVQIWARGKDYYRGELVEHKTQYYVAMEDIPGSGDFDFNKWKQITRGEIKTGLLPNFTTIAAQGEYSYNPHAYFKNEEQLRFGHSLIGFKPRQYLDDLGLNDTTQIEFYKGYIKQKGTSNAINQLTKARFNNLTSDIRYYEEWAVRVGEYGALGINPFAEIVLDENQYAMNPSTARFVDAENINEGDGLTVFSSKQLYRQFGNYTGNIALVRDDSSYYDQDIPTAGYVHLDDVDITIFDLNTFDQLNSEIENVGVGYTIWVAKDFTQDWDVLRVSETNNTVTLVENALDNFVVMHTGRPHSFQPNQIFILRYFNPQLDGFYNVVDVLDTERILVEFNGDPAYYASLTSEQGNGVILKLDSMRFQYMEDARVYGLNNPLNYWKVGDKIWIDDDAATFKFQGQPVDTNSNTWKVYEKTEPWQKVQRLAKKQSDYLSNDGYGSAVKISDNGLYAVAGSPYANSFTNGSTYQSGHIITLNRQVNPTTLEEEFVQGDTVTAQAGIIVTRTVDFINDRTLHLDSVEDLQINMLVNKGFPAGTYIEGIDAANSNVIMSAASIESISNVALQFSKTVAKEFGQSVDLASTFLLTGAPGSEYNRRANVGLAYVYQRPEGTLAYAPYQVLVGNANTSGRFGASVTCDEFGNWIYVGAPDESKVYVYGLNRNISEKQQLVSINSQKILTLAANVSIPAGDILQQKIYKKAANINVLGVSVLGSVLTLSSVTGLYPGMVANAAFAPTTTIVSVDYANFTVTMSAGATGPANVALSFADFLNVTTIEARVLTTVSSSNIVEVDDRNGLYAGSNDEVIVLGSLEVLQLSDPFIPLVNLGTVISNIESFTNTSTIQLEFTPDVANNAHSLFVGDYNRIYIPEVDYTLSGTILSFTAGNLQPGDYVIRQRPYYQHITTLQGSNNSEFGYALDASLDGAQLGVGTPNDSVNVAVRTDNVKISVPLDTATANVASYTVYPGAGGVYVYDRVIEAFNSNGTRTYETTYPIGLVYRVTIDDVEVPFSQYQVVSSNVIEFVEAPGLGRIVFIETNKFNLLEKLIGVDSLEGGLDAIQAYSRFGTDLTICSNNCAIYVGAPNYDSGDKYNIGAVWKFHNKGRLYGINRGFSPNPSFAPNDSIRLDNFELKVNLQTSNDLFQNVFVGDGLTKIFGPMSYVYNPGEESLVNVSVGSQTLTAGTDYVFFGNTQIHFTTAPFASSEIEINHNQITSGLYIEQPSTGANVQINDTVNNTYLRVSDYQNGNVFALGTGNLTINGRVTSVYPVRTNLDNFVTDVNDAGLLGISAKNENNYLVINSDRTVAKNLLRILSGKNISNNVDGISNVYNSAGLAVFAFMQIIVSPYNNNSEHFGNRVVLARNAYMLVIGTDRGTTRHLTTFDNELTTFDDGSTEIFDSVLGSGSVYIYELYDDPRNMVEHPGRYAFAQQLDPGDLNSGDRFGADVDISGGYIITSAPTDDTLTYFIFNSDNVTLVPGDIITQPLSNLSRYEVVGSFVDDYYVGSTRIRETKATVKPTRNAAAQAGSDIAVYVNNQPVLGYIARIIENTGSVYIFSNPTLKRGWNLIRYQEPRVDLESVSRVYLYDKVSNTINTNLEFLDPVKGKILGVAEQEITYKTAYDPAYYNRGTGERGNVAENLYWGENQVGQVWWNLSKCRFIDYEQDTLTYRANNWGRLFPGSIIEVCEWVESSVLPSQHVDQGFDGVPIYSDDSAYVEVIFVDPQTNIITSKFYYWVTNKNSVDITNPTRKIPTSVISSLIANPKAQNIPYCAILSKNALGFFNINRYLSSNNTICHIDYEILRNSSIIHSEYECLQSGNPDSFIPEKISNKLIDSLSGQDAAGNPVPDPLLSEYDRYGISYRPRQSMFIDRQAALRNLVEHVNKILIQYPIVREYQLDYFLREEPLPKENEYDLFLPAVDELPFVDTEINPVGFKVLIGTDTTQDGLWVMYQLNSQRQWQIIRTQSYKTSLYWEYVDWYDEGFNSTEIIEYVVDTLVDALKLPVSIGDEVLVRVNTGVITQGWNLLTVLDDGSYKVVGIEKGTVQLKDSLYNFADNKLGFGNQNYDVSRYDQNPGIELRNLILGLKEDIFTRLLEGEYNKLFFVMVNYLLTEQKYVDWIFKTSFISVTHQLRALTQYPSFIKDNQTYYLDYINEVKPYATKVREYNLSYTGDDEFSGDLTDFDLPPYYDRELDIFRSPSGEQIEKDRQLWATGYLGDTLINIDYPSWYLNKDYEIYDIIIEDPGLGYVIEPSVTIIGGGNTVEEQATATATIDFDTGSVISITVLTKGKGYSQTPTVIINGGATRPARAYPLLKKEYSLFDPELANSKPTSSKVRTFDTALKFDRTAYNSGVRAWQPNTNYYATQITTINGRQYWVGGDIVTHTVKDGDTFIRKAYTVLANVTTGNTFVSDQFQYYHAANFTCATDRILAYYEPQGSMPGRDLTLLMTGLTYPGVEVQGMPFNEEFGFTGTYTANIRFSSAISVGVGNVITQSEADILIHLNHEIENVSIGSYVTQPSSGANASLYGNTILHGSGLGTLGNVTNDFNLYLIKSPSSPTFDTTGNIYINGVEQVKSTYGNVQESNLSLAVYEGLISTGAIAISDFIEPPMFGSGWVNIKTNAAPYSWSNVGIKPTWSNVVANINGSLQTVSAYVESPISDASMTVTKVFADGNVQGIVNSSQEFITGTGSALGGNIKINGVGQNAHPTAIYYISSATEASFDRLNFDAFDVDEEGNPILSEDNYDSIIRSFYTDSLLGLRPEDINVDGGEYVDTYASHAPEELVPGIVFDTVDIKVFQNGPGSTINAFKIFSRSFQYTAYAGKQTHFNETTYLRMCDDYSTILAQPLRLTDTVIYVSDASKLPEPSPENAEPGVIFVGAERITYYERDIVANTLGRIRRGTKGTAAKSLHQIGAIVIDGSKQQVIPGTTWANITLRDNANANANVSTSITSIINNTFANGKPDGTGLDASTSDAGLFIKECNARNVLGLVLTRAIATEDAVNTLITENGDDLYEEDF